MDDRRRDYFHKVTTELAQRYDVFVMEDLTLDFMLRNRHLARAAYDVALGEFRTLLAEKVRAAGGRIIKVDPAYTSQICSGCGTIVEKSLSVRVHHCSACGLTLDRDVNAARNILQIAVKAGMLSAGDNSA